ncbi:reverse transcriptase domain-containing protein [Tanacetum coccineum]
MTVVENEDNELIPTRLVMGWRVYIDYRKLNDATRKDHFPFPFIDQMLERLAGNEYYCFLDGFSGYFQIPSDPQDQEKTTFTCPYGTFAYLRMPFGLCNASGTFQRCMMAIFHDMIEETMERKYVVEILERAHIVNCNPSRTPVDTEYKLGDDGDLSSKRQPTLSRLSAEAEYHGVTNVVAETCWLRNLLHLVVVGHVRVLHVPSRYQYADIFTKGLPSVLFEDFRTSLSAPELVATFKKVEGLLCK